MPRPEGVTVPRTARQELALRLRHLSSGAVNATVGSAIRTIEGARRALTPAASAIPKSDLDPFQSSSVTITTKDTTAVQLPPNTVTLSMFNSHDRTLLAPLIRYYVGGDIDVVAAHADPKTHRRYEERRWKRYHKYHPDVTRSQYSVMREEQLRRQADVRNERINRHVFRRIQEDLGTTSERSAANAFEAQRQHANNTVRNNAAVVFPGEIRTQQHNEVDLPQLPSDMVDIFFSPTTHTEEMLQTEIQRQALLTAVSTQIEQGITGIAGRKLKDIQNLLNEQLYAGKRGAITIKMIYGIFDNNTNEILADAEGKPQIFEEAPTDEAPAGTHYKRYTLPMRQIQGTGEYVRTKIGQKERPNSISKALFEAYKRADRGETGHINPQDIEDTHRMMLVVMGDDEAAERLLERIFDIVTDGTNALSLCNRDYLGRPITVDGELTGVPTDFKTKHDTKEGNGAPEKVGNHKLKIYFDGLSQPIEIIVRPFYQHFLSELEVGAYDETTNQYTGIAHDIYKVKRETEISGIYFPHSDFPDFVRPNVPNADGRYPPHIGLEKTVTNLREEAVFVPKVHDN